MLEEKVRKTIREYNLIEKNDSIVVGVSGGPDSMTLLSILLKLKEEFNLKIYVAHVNHMLRENAIKDEEYVKVDAMISAHFYNVYFLKTFFSMFFKVCKFCVISKP